MWNNYDEMLVSCGNLEKISKNLQKFSVFCSVYNCYLSHLALQRTGFCSEQICKTRWSDF